MEAAIQPHMTYADKILLQNLTTDLRETRSSANGFSDRAALEALTSSTDENSKAFLGSPFSRWDEQDLNTSIRVAVVEPYVRWASGVVRRRADVVFLTHVGFYCATLLPSAIALYYHFTWWHAVLHELLVLYCAGPFTLLLHNHIHNNGLLKPGYAWFDRAFPYFLGPLMGHTPNSYYYHHVKHHHVEENGPGDLSSTIRYQRDELRDFLVYLGRFLALCWIELPLYFFRRRKYESAFKSLVWEVSAMAAMFWAATYDLTPTMSVFIIPLIQMRVGMMVGNWGQHALVDEIDPRSNFRSSITLIDTQSNRYCFNDGYHTSHHLNSRRHWRDHPASFLKAKSQYQVQGALVFHNIDYIEITYRLLTKNYDHLARCLVPIGDQIGKSHKELASMLRTKTQRFSEESIAKIFGKA